MMYLFCFYWYTQEWDWSKKLERWFKTTFLMKDAAGLSAVEPVTYQARFMVRIGGIMNLTEEGTVSSIMDPLPTTFPSQSQSQSQLKGFVNDHGSYQESTRLSPEATGPNVGIPAQVSSVGGSSVGGGYPARRMTQEEYKEMRSSISTTGTNSLRPSSFSERNTSATQFQGSTPSQFDGISSAHSLDINSMSNV